MYCFVTLSVIFLKQIHHSILSEMFIILNKELPFGIIQEIDIYFNSKNFEVQKSSKLSRNNFFTITKEIYSLFLLILNVFYELLSSFGQIENSTFWNQSVGPSKRINSKRFPSNLTIYTQQHFWHCL